MVENAPRPISSSCIDLFCWGGETKTHLFRSTHVGTAAATLQAYTDRDFSTISLAYSIMICFDQEWEVSLGQDGRSFCAATACVVRYSCILRGQGQRLEVPVNVLRDDYSHMINADCSSVICSSIKLNLSTNPYKKLET